MRQAFIIIVIFAALFSGCTQTVTTDLPPTDSYQESPSQVDESQNVVELIAERDGQTPFELLKEKHEISFKEYDFGVFIESIDGVMGDDQNYWALYVNDEYATLSADQLKLKAGDKVEWVFEGVSAESQ